MSHSILVSLPTLIQFIFLLLPGFQHKSLPHVKWNWENGVAEKQNLKKKFSITIFFFSLISPLKFFQTQNICKQTYYKHLHGDYTPSSLQATSL